MKHGWAKCITCIYSAASRFALHRFARAFRSPNRLPLWWRAAGATEAHDHGISGPETMIRLPSR
jgi:hypothetical protein